jgi:hypothetical protein
MRLTWQCANNTDGGTGSAGRDGGNTGAAGFRVPDGGLIVDGGLNAPACPANTATGGTCVSGTDQLCNAACNNNRQRSCLCGNNNRWTCFNSGMCGN